MHYHVYYAYNVNKYLYTLDKEHNSQKVFSKEVATKENAPPLYFFVIQSVSVFEDTLSYLKY